MIESLFDAFSGLPESIIVYDRDGEIRYANRYADTYLGYHHGGLLRKNICSFDTRHMTPEQLAINWEKRAAKESYKDISLYRHHDGTLLPVEISSSVIFMDGEALCISVIHDITERQHRSEELNLLHTLIDDSHDMVYILRLEDGFIHYANKTAERVLGYSLQEQRQMGIEGFRRPLKEGEAFMEHLEELKAAGKMTDYAMLTRKDGTEFPVEVNARFVEYQGKSYNIAIGRDITERVEYENRLHRLNEELETMVEERTQALESNIARLNSYKMAMDTNSIVSISDTGGRITYVNENFCKVSGYSAEEAIGKPHSIVRHPETPSSVFKEMWRTIQSKNVWQGILKNRKKDGGYYYVDIAILPILDAAGEIMEYIAVRHEITEIIEREEEIKRRAYLDELTGMGSRLKLLNDISEHPDPMLAYIDIDQFSNINDFYGMAFGDRFIKSFAELLQERFQDSEIYRLHGDQFALLGGCAEMTGFESRLRSFVEGFMQSNYTFEGQELTIRLTATLSCESADKLLSTVELTHHHAKKANTPYARYSPELGLEEEVRANVSCSVRLQKALDEDRIAVFCQPLAHADTLEKKKYECLVRLIDEEGKAISPYFFLEMAKRSKQYGELSKRVMQKAFGLVEAYPEREFSVNITIDDILNPDVSEYILKRLCEKRSSQPVIFELVESEGIENFDEVARFIDQIKLYDAKLAIDDFGTGYSNFEYLLRLKADFIKIDGSLIKNIDSDPNIRNIVKLMVGFAKQQKMQTVAEFVESETIADAVRELGIDYLQGYHIGKPEPMTE